MIVQLRIVNLALIEEAELAFEPGLNILTGETGAGKSLVAGAAALLRGGRMRAEMIRAGCHEAVVEALFDLSGLASVRQTLERRGLQQDNGDLLVRRRLSSAGRGQVHVNGGLCTLGMLRQVAGDLLEISGQHEYQRLSDRAVHRELVDALALTADDRRIMAEAHGRLVQLADELRQSQLDDRRRAERIDFLRYQLGELEAAALSPGEDRRLERDLARLRRSAEIREAAGAGERDLYSGDGSASDTLSRVGRSLEAVATVEPQLGRLAAQIDEARILVEDVAMELARFSADEELDPGRLDALEERLDLIVRLRRKHGATVDEVLDRQQEMDGELSRLERLEEHLDRLEAELSGAQKEAAQTAATISGKRRDAADKLSRRVAGHLAGLRMKGARLESAVDPLPVRDDGDPAMVFEGRRIEAHGWDRVELLIATNPGEPAKPLARVASGGELSRVMLALRRVLGQHAPVATSIFDEVDAGIGGAVADVVGEYLARVARHQQVICVTHLPQVAAYADAHFHVGKKTHNKRTRTVVTRLDGEQQRGRELARMLGGKQVGKRAMDNALELLQTAAERKGL